MAAPTSTEPGVPSKHPVRILDIGLNSDGSGTLPPCIVAPTAPKRSWADVVLEGDKNSGRNGNRGKPKGGAPQQRRRWKPRHASNDVVQELKNQEQRLAGERDALRELNKQAQEFLSEQKKKEIAAAEEKKNKELEEKKNKELLAKIDLQDKAWKLTYDAAVASLDSYLTEIVYLDKWVCKGYLRGRWMSLIRWLIPYLFFTAMRLYLWESYGYGLAIILGFLYYDLIAVLSMQVFYIVVLALAKAKFKSASRFVFRHHKSIFYWFSTVCWVNREEISKVVKDFTTWNPGHDLRPRSLAQTELIDPEARVTMQYQSGRFLRFKLKVFLWGKIYIEDYSNDDRQKSIKIRPSIALASHLVHGDICGLNSDPEVAKNRIDARLRSIQSVNVNRFSAQLDDVYGDTALLALFCWRKRIERRRDFPK